MAPIELPLSRALTKIRTGDVGLLAPTSREGRWIVRIGRSQFSHAVLFYWRSDSRRRRALWIVEQIDPEGRTLPAEPYLRECPSGTCSIYRPAYASRWRAARAVDWALANVPGTPYDRRGLARSLYSHLGFLRWWIRPEEDDEANGGDRRPLYCSAAVARAIRRGGQLDLVPGLADTWTEPGDLAKSAALTRLFTISLCGGER